MADKASRRGAANMGVLMMILAFVAMAVFLYWLSLQSAKQKAVEIREDSVALAATAAQNALPPGALVVPPDTLQAAGLGKYDNQLIQLEGLTVSKELGKQGFWLTVPKGKPVLVALTPALLQEALTVKAGESPTVVGTVHLMTDSTVNAWAKGGMIAHADSVAAIAVQFYLSAREISVKTNATGGS